MINSQARIHICPSPVRGPWPVFSNSPLPSNKLCGYKKDNVPAHTPVVFLGSKKAMEEKYWLCMLIELRSGWLMEIE